MILKEVQICLMAMERETCNQLHVIACRDCCYIDVAGRYVRNSVTRVLQADLVERTASAGTCCLHHYRLGDGCNRHFRNVGKLVPDYTAQQATRQPVQSHVMFARYQWHTCFTTCQLLVRWAFCEEQGWAQTCGRHSGSARPAHTLIRPLWQGW
jgi:hypothetical protein